MANTNEQCPTLEKLLDRLDHLQNQRLVQELVANHPELKEEIEQFVISIPDRDSSQQSYNITPHSTSSKKQSPSVRRTTVDPTPYQKQVRQILRDAVRSWEDGYDEDPVSEEILSIIQTAVDFSERGDGNNALIILAAITQACVENWDDVADYGAENEEIVEALNSAWCEAILTTEFTEEEKLDLEENLEAWQDEWSANFEMALEALRQGWDYPPLVRVLQGNVTKQGAWEGEPPDYADDLALIRLKILESDERYQEYLYLAEAEGQTKQYLTMLGRLGRVEEAMNAAQTQMTSMNEAFALAKTLQEQGALAQALQIAQTGLKLEGNCQYDLGTWTSDLAVELGDKQAALSAKIAAFAAKPSFTDYQKIEELAGENWASVKTDLLQILRTYKGWGCDEAKVAIFLHEGLIEDAIAIVSELSSYSSQLIHSVMDAAISHNPDWVIANARRRAESIMDGGKAEHYDNAVEWLKKARAAYLESGRKADWATYREKLVQTHGRKYKLMGLFKQRDMQ
ncbi:SWIM zinc finger domain-containing protein [Iningainema tapete]|uniref:SWIM zinc finger domain-containing protein n=1 Tax=Iningainema tapete BLCC-T55 TaxID=2748662 RepID=A0A8J6XR55_9CYAN|nr:SWIM zinc finger domain-containing protein [Iningainema tapete]MBD2778047.1 SWIM zinc finger domain-containing protein [Iningainema tapete BLCC-T55]